MKLTCNDASEPKLFDTQIFLYTRSEIIMVDLCSSYISLPASRVNMLIISYKSDTMLFSNNISNVSCQY